MADSYSILSKWYDKLMDDFDYPSLTAYYCSAIKKYSEDLPKQILDLGCGTGSVSIILAEKGFDVTGIDISSEMLSMAALKTNEQNLKIKYACENMAYLDAGRGYGAAVCSLDGLNYLVDKEELSSCISRVADALVSGGLFMFDVNTKYKYENVYADNSYVYDLDDFFLVWQNYYKKSTCKCSFYLTFFEKKGKNWSRSDEVQIQKYYSEKTISRVLDENGFDILNISAGFDNTELSDKDEKHYYICKKR